MTKNEWLSYLSKKIRNQISLEAVEKFQTWAVGFLALISFGFALGGLSSGLNGLSLLGTKVFFLILFNLVLIFGLYLPTLLQKGEKPAAKLLGICDFTGLTLATAGFLFYAVTVLMLSWQAAVGVSDYEMSGFFKFVMWSHFLLALFYAGHLIFYAIGFSAFPAAIAKLNEKSATTHKILMWIHAGMVLLLGVAYAGITPIGSAAFFEHFRLSGLFWIFIVSSLVLIGKLARESAVPALNSIDLEMVSGKLEKHDDILVRFKDAYVPRRLVTWIFNLSHKVATQSHEILHYSQDAIGLVNRDKPSEIDLRQVEDRYRRADLIYKKIDKDYQRFLLSVSLFDLSETAQGKVNELKDQFSRELRHAKLELAGIRKRIDDKLTSLKETVLTTASNIPVEEIPSAKR